MSYIRDLQLKAMLAVTEPDVEAQMRRIRRFYSKTFHTPLADVDVLDEEFVLQAYFEEIIEDMSPETREEFTEELVASPDELVARKNAEAEAADTEARFLENLNKDVKDGKRRGPPKERPKAKFPPAPPSPEEKTRLIKERISGKVERSNSADGELVIPPQPDIHMSFPDSNLQNSIPPDWGEMSSLGPAPQKK